MTIEGENMSNIKVIKCKNFVNANCSFNCPNAALEKYLEKYDIDYSDIGQERIKCKDCRYQDKYCTCEKDCYLYGSEYCKYTD